MVFDLLVIVQTTFKKQLRILGYKLAHEQLQIPPQETIFKNVLKMYALAADRTHTPIIVENALGNTGWPSRYNASIVFQFTEGSELETNT